MQFVQSNCKDGGHFYFNKGVKLVFLFMILCKYLKDNPYIIAECNDFTDGLTLPSSVSCSISSGCSNILCCTKMDFISRGIQTRVSLDPCDYKLTLGIETMNVTTSLLDYTWGRSETFSLQGGFKLKLVSTLIHFFKLKGWGFWCLTPLSIIFQLYHYGFLNRKYNFCELYTWIPL
jgi:hypothetical protein